MVVFGGRSDTNDQFFSHELLVYNVKCNYWQLLSGMIVLAFHSALHSNLHTLEQPGCRENYPCIEDIVAKKEIVLYTYL